MVIRIFKVSKFFGKNFNSMKKNIEIINES